MRTGSNSVCGILLDSESCLSLSTYICVLRHANAHNDSSRRVKLLPTRGYRRLFGLSMNKAETNTTE